MTRIVVAGSAALALTPATAAADPTAFGRACVPEGDHRLCAAPGLDGRVPSWDGTPIDVDVRIPATGDGPWPTVVWLHGFGDGKEVVAGNAGAYADAGYAAVNLSARGFKGSCGDLTSRTPDCARGWLHVADQRYEVRDIQHLLGVLADQGIVVPDRIGATGSSYAGIQALQLGFLRDRIRLPDGGYAPWRSPAGTPMRVAGVAPQLAWSDAVSAMFPGGATGASGRAQPGFRLASFFDLIAGGAQLLNLVAPPGADPTIDFQRWLTLKGDELATPAGRTVLDELHRYHSALAIGGSHAPVLMVQGWTDSAIPVSHALAVYRALRKRDRRAKVWLTLSDFGHWRSMNKRRTIDLVGARNLRFFDKHLRGRGSFPAPGQVTVYRENCANPTSDGPAIQASSYDRLARGRVRVSARGRLGAISARGGLAAVGVGVDPVASQQHCTTIPAVREPRTASVDLTVRRDVTYLGRGVIRARIRGTGGPRGQVVARLWHVAGGRQRLLDRSITLVRLPRRGTVRLDLNGNAVRLRRGERLRLQLLGRDSPTYEAPDDDFSITVSGLRLELPTRERRPGAALAVTRRG